MAGFSRSAALRRALLGDKPNPPVFPSFTRDEWQHSQIVREAIDSLAVVTRWHVTVVPSDRTPRTFYLSGLLDNVTRRANLIFGEYTRVVAIEPAATLGAEIYDCRLNLGRTYHDSVP